MNKEQEKALNNCFDPSFSEEDAKHILNWYGMPELESSLPVGVVKAIEKLGGRYDSSWGVVVLPNYQPVDEI